MSKSNRRLDQNDKNPCLKEHEISLRCLDRTGYDAAQCDKHFENYKRCKKFWGQVMRHRREHHITPDLPPVEDRERIKNEFLKKSPIS